MRYDEMQRIYPNIEELFAGVAELIHDDKVSLLMTAEWARRWIARNIGPIHKLSVSDLVCRFIIAICGDDKDRDDEIALKLLY